MLFKNNNLLFKLSNRFFVEFDEKEEFDKRASNNFIILSIQHLKIRVLKRIILKKYFHINKFGMCRALGTDR